MSKTVVLPQSDSPSVVASVSFWQAFRFWLKLGFISFGGPAGQIAMMHQELVDNRRWISEGRFLHALNFCMVLPGPEAQQLATYIGWLMHKTWGGVIAGVLFILPSLVLLIALAWIYLVWGDVAVVAGIFYGIKPAVAAIVLQAAHRIGSRALKNGAYWAIAAAAFVAIFALNVPFPLIVLAAALVGFIGGRLAPTIFGKADAHRAQSHPGGAAIIDDTTPIPAHAIFSWRRTSQVLIAGMLLWLVPMAALTLMLGWAHPLTQMSWFFTKAALMTFGGAYAVLPYVYQGAVTHYGWLTAGQMMDGLALGESTPGPLIMVVTFVGFVGGYTKAVLGVDDVLLDLLVFYVIQGIDVDGFLKDLLKIRSDGRQREGDDRKAGLVARDILVHHRHGQIPVFQEQPLLLFCEGPGLFLIDRRKAFLSKGLHHSRSGVFCGFLFVLLIGSL